MTVLEIAICFTILLAMTSIAIALVAIANARHAKETCKLFEKTFIQPQIEELPLVQQYPEAHAQWMAEKMIEDLILIVAEVHTLDDLTSTVIVAQLEKAINSDDGNAHLTGIRVYDSKGKLMLRYRGQYQPPSEFDYSDIEEADNQPNEEHSH